MTDFVEALRTLTSTPRRMRAAELCLVLVVSFAGPLVSSFVVLSGTSSLGNYDVLRITNAIVMEISCLLLLAYVLMRQGRTFRELGLTFKAIDLLSSIGIAILALLAHFAAYRLLASISRYWSGGSSPASGPAFHMGISVVAVLFMVLNPVFEETIVRAFLITEISALTSRTWLAILVSTVLQATYHLYQGWTQALSAAAMFLVFSLTFAQTRRAFPIILAHFYFDILALLYSR